MYARILVPFDGSTTSTLGLHEAVKLAKLTGARIRLLHVVNELTNLAGFDAYSGLGTDMCNLLRQAGEEVLAHGRAVITAAGVEVSTELVENFSLRLSDVVLQQARDWKADLIVIGTHGRRGIQRVFLGSDAEMIVRTALVPVLLVRAQEAVRDR